VNPLITEALDRIRKDLDLKFKVYPIYGNRALSPTNEPYMEFVGREWTLQEGDPRQRVSLYDSPEAAVLGLEYVIDKYTSGKKGRLYWRVLPEINEWKGKWKFYARFLISDKPIVDTPKSLVELI
jgi:hypothetical protein